MTYKKFYPLSLAIVILVSAYPLYMGASVLISLVQNGYVSAGNYPRYVIPYTPICLALITTAVLLPFFFKYFKKFTLPAASVFGTAAFFAAEIGFEQIQVMETLASPQDGLPLDIWQYALCVATPQVLRSIGEPTYAESNPAYKFHFYIIALVIILAVVSLLYGFSKMFRNKDYTKKRPLAVQLACVAAFVGLCVWASFTAFYRNGTITISALSAGLMSVFFTVFGVTFGVYFGCVFYGKRKILSVITPAIAAAVMTSAMYVGELLLMGGEVFRFGSGTLFEPIGAFPLAPADLVVILCPAVLTFFICKRLNTTVVDKNQQRGC